jgi:tetratricopeptide (TPR) repeat protein
MPDDPLIQEHLGDAYAKVGKTKEALEIYKRALELNPEMESVSTKIQELLERK